MRRSGLRHGDGSATWSFEATPRISSYITAIVAGPYEEVRSELTSSSGRVIPLGDAPVETVHHTRLWLNDATGQVLRNGLTLLGVSAPERM